MNLEKRINTIRNLSIAAILILFVGFLGIACFMHAAYGKLDFFNIFFIDDAALPYLKNAAIIINFVTYFIIFLWFLLSLIASIITLASKWKGPKTKQYSIILGILSLLIIGAFGTIAFYRIAKVECLANETTVEDAIENHPGREDNVNYDHVKVDKQPDKDDIYL